MTCLTKEDLREKLLQLPIEQWIRVPVAVAKELLLNNESIICGGNVFYFWIRDLGLGVCEVCKAPMIAKETEFWGK